MRQAPETGRRYLAPACWICAVLAICVAPLRSTHADGEPPDAGYRVVLPTGAGEVVDIPGVGAGVVVPPGYGQWGFVRLPVEPVIPPGTITLTVRYYGDPRRPALTLLYGEGTADEHLPPYGLRLPAAADGAVHEATFALSSAKPIRNLILKRGEAGDAVTLPVLEMRVGWAESQPDPRVRAYHLLLQRPAPNGIVNDSPRAWLDEVAAAGRRLDDASASAARERTERCLAAESHIAWVADRAGYLEVASRLLAPPSTDARARGIRSRREEGPERREGRGCRDVAGRLGDADP